MPQRFLRPGITTSKRFNRLDYLAQTFYVRLVTLVDDFGRYDADPMLLRSHAFPLGAPDGKDIPLKTVVNICLQMFTNGLAIFYKVDGRELLELTRWIEKPRATASKYPANSESCEQMFTNDNKCSSPSSSSPPSPLYHRPRSNAIASTQLRWSEAESWSGKSDSLVEELKTAYPACDVNRQFLEMEQWLRANPARAHKTNWRRFVDGWLRKKQDRGGDRAGINNGTTQHPSRPRTLSFVEVERRIMKIRERRNDMFKMRTDRYTGAEREFTAEEQDKYDKLTEELTALEG